MAHGLEKSSDMVYNGRNEVPWHKLGTPLPGLATVAEVMEACPALAAKVVKEQAMHNGREVRDTFHTVRQDTGQVLGTVGSKYRVLDNADAFKFMDRLTQDPNGPKYETAGVLWGGAVVWILAVLPDVLEVVPGDVLKPYVLLRNSHDGSGSVLVRETPVRVVCNNTLNMALGSAGRKTSLRHTGDILAKVQDVQDALGIIRNDFKLTTDVFRDMAKVEPTADQVAEVLARLFPDTATERAKLQRDRVMQLAANGAGNAPVAGTAWALYNGVTELVDHVNNAGSKRADADDMRTNSVLFGSGFAQKTDALAAIREVCGV